MMRAQAAGVKIALLSASFNGEAVRLRAKALGISLVHVGPGPKAPVLTAWMRQLDLTAADVAFIGDDTNDLEAMQQVGLRACPADAAPLVRRSVHVVLGAAGGQGCVREFIDQFVPEG